VRIILTRATWILGKKKPVNTCMEVTIEKFKELGDSCEEYKGVFPPKKKHKMNLSQLKT
jgi:hypothetical protein